MQILIADDHDLVRDGLKPILAKLDPNVSILECDNFPEALALADQPVPPPGIPQPLSSCPTVRVGDLLRRAC